MKSKYTEDDVLPENDVLKKIEHLKEVVMLKLKKLYNMLKSL